MNSTNYTQLKKEIWDTGLCSGCSLCSTVCPMKTIQFCDTVPSSNNYCKNEKDLVICGACHSCCPRIDTYKEKYGLGEIRSALAARSSIPVAKKQSGGAITAILYNALQQQLIDAVVLVGQDPPTLETMSIALKSPEDVITHAGSRYIWHTPSLLALRDIVENGSLSKVAVVGTPCVMQALKKMLQSDNVVLNRFKDHVKLLIGVFCTEIFEYGPTIRYLKENGIEPCMIQRIDIKKNLIIELYNEDVVELEIPSWLKREGCKYCLDFSAVDADISAGSIGSEEGYTTLLARTPLGEFFVNSAIENDCLDVEPIESLSIVERFCNIKKKKNLKNIGILEAELK